MDPTLRKTLFDAGQESPGAWLMKAMSLHAAAMRLDPVDAPVQANEGTTSLASEHSMMLGMSFELLLKAIIMINRLNAGAKEPLPKNLQVGHDLARLAAHPDCASAAVSTSEIAILEHLSPFIPWGGRYPYPKREADYEPLAWLSRNRPLQMDFWTRLAEIVKEKGWVMKGGSSAAGGTKLMMRPRS